MSLDPFASLAKKLAPYQKSDRKSRRYPPALWAKILELTRHHSPATVAQQLQISPAHLARKMAKKSPSPRHSSLPSDLVQIPVSLSSPCLMELQYPNGLKIKVFAQ